MEKWVAAVGKPDWKPKKTSRICSLHFNKNDIIQGMGYQRLYLRKNAVPKNYSLFIAEEEQIGIAMLYSKKICNAVDTSKAVNSSETYVLDNSAARDHNYSKNVNTMIENNRSSTCGTQDPNQSLQKSILHPDKECDFIQTDSNSVFISHSSINFNTEKKISFDFVDASRKIKKLSKSIENLKLKNKTLQQKIRRYNKRIILFKQMFDHLEQKKLISDDLSQLMRKQISRLTLQINQNNKGRKSNSQHYTDEVKTFTLSIYYISLKTYEFCR